VAVAEGGVRGEVREYGRIANTAAALDRVARKLGREGVRLRRRHPRRCHPWETSVRSHPLSCPPFQVAGK
jgi:hypothetical protein